MKWFNRTAQGFSPGDIQHEPRPERATDARDVLSGRVFFCSGVGDPIRSPLQGEFMGTPFPGLKPWAILFDHFMVKNCKKESNEWRAKE
jgi:hypothetical protein